MRVFTKSLAAALLLVLAATLVTAADGGIRTVSGRVVSVDVKAATLVVRPETSSLQQPADVTLSFDGDTKIRKAGLKITLADIHPGDIVTANFKADGARSLALALLVE